MTSVQLQGVSFAAEENDVPLVALCASLHFTLKSKLPIARAITFS
jgi:hypothetical protein